MSMSRLKLTWIIVGFTIGCMVGHTSFLVSINVAFEAETELLTAVPSTQDKHNVTNTTDQKTFDGVPSTNVTNTLLNRTDQKAFRVLRRRLVTVFGLESSGTTFLAETLAKAVGANTNELIEAVKWDVKGSTFVSGGLRDELRFNNREIEIQHVSLPWGHHNGAVLNESSIDMPPIVEFIAPANCMVYPLYLKSDSSNATNDQQAPPHQACYEETGIKQRVQYPVRFFVDIVSHVRWYRERAVHATAVIMVRDEGIHLHGKQNHTNNISRAIKEDRVGKAIIANAIKELDASVGEILLVSYETLMSLKEVYLFHIYKKLGIDSTFIPNFKNGNEKYIRVPPIVNKRSSESVKLNDLTSSFFVSLPVPNRSK